MASLGDTWWVSQKQLDPDQINAFNLKKDQSHLILGPPGSGKTNLLLLRAEYLTRARQPNIRLIVFTRTLQEFIRQGLDESKKFPPENVVTHIKFFQEILRENSFRTDEELPEDFDELRSELATRMVELLDEEKLDKSYQVLLLDEVQDYRPEELGIFNRLAERLFVTGDVRQQIYKVKKSIETVQAIVDNTTTLRFHYRNGQNICRLADGIMKGRPGYTPMIDTSKYVEADHPSTVIRYREEYPRLEDQCTKVVDELKTQLRAYEGELLGIICTRNSDLDKVWNILRMSGLKDQIVYQRAGGYVPFDNDHPICLCSLTSAKGLEFRTLHIVGADHLKGEPQPRQKAYMAVTRAKTSLTIYGPNALIGPFQAALDAIEPSGPEPTLGDIFGEDE